MPPFEPSADHATRVLLVEDHDDVRRLYEESLERHFDVVAAADGVEALNVFDEGFDIVLLDWTLPHISGREVLAQLHDSNPNVPVMIVSGTDPVSDVDDLPCVEWMLKPVGVDQLADRICAHVRATDPESVRQSPIDS